MQKAVIKTSTYVISICFALFLVCSCNDKKQHLGKTPVARVYDKYLYKEDMAGLIPSGVSKEDSILKAKSYIDFWVKRYAMTKTAELNLAEEQKDVAEELENYRMDLLIFRYKQKFIEQNLDTVVTEKHITDFYLQHEKEFILYQPAVKVMFIKILKNSPNLGLVRNLYKSKRETDIQQVKESCEEYSTLCNDYNDEWIYFKDIIIEIPVRIDDQELYLKSNTSVETSDSTYFYFLNIKDYRLKDQVAPLNFVAGNIQSMILNQRKQELLNVIEKNVYNSMLDTKDIEIFENE